MTNRSKKYFKHKKYIKNNIFCHKCGSITDWICNRCDEPVCENCIELPSYMNQLTETICKTCYN